MSDFVVASLLAAPVLRRSQSLPAPHVAHPRASPVQTAVSRTADVPLPTAALPSALLAPKTAQTGQQNTDASGLRLWCCLAQAAGLQSQAGAQAAAVDISAQQLQAWEPLFVQTLAHLSLPSLRARPLWGMGRLLDLGEMLTHWPMPAGPALIACSERLLAVLEDCAIKASDGSATEAGLLTLMHLNELWTQQLQREMRPRTPPQQQQQNKPAEKPAAAWQQAALRGQQAQTPRAPTTPVAPVAPSTQPEHTAVPMPRVAPSTVVPVRPAPAHVPKPSAQHSANVTATATATANKAATLPTTTKTTPAQTQASRAIAAKATAAPIAAAQNKVLPRAAKPQATVVSRAIPQPHITSAATQIVATQPAAVVQVISPGRPTSPLPAAVRPEDAISQEPLVPVAEAKQTGPTKKTAAIHSWAALLQAYSDGACSHAYLLDCAANLQQEKPPLALLGKWAALWGQAKQKKTSNALLDIVGLTLAKQKDAPRLAQSCAGVIAALATSNSSAGWAFVALVEQKTGLVWQLAQLMPLFKAAPPQSDKAMLLAAEWLLQCMDDAELAQILAGDKNLPLLAWLQHKGSQNHAALVLCAARKPKHALLAPWQQILLAEPEKYFPRMLACEPLLPAGQAGYAVMGQIEKHFSPQRLAAGLDLLCSEWHTRKLTDAQVAPMRLTIATQLQRLDRIAPHLPLSCDHSKQLLVQFLQGPQSQADAVFTALLGALQQVENEHNPQIAEEVLLHALSHANHAHMLQALAAMTHVSLNECMRCAARAHLIGRCINGLSQAIYAGNFVFAPEQGWQWLQFVQTADLWQQTAKQKQTRAGVDIWQVLQQESFLLHGMYALGQPELLTCLWEMLVRDKTAPVAHARAMVRWALQNSDNLALHVQLVRLLHNPEVIDKRIRIDITENTLPAVQMRAKVAHVTLVTELQAQPQPLRVQPGLPDELKRMNVAVAIPLLASPEHSITKMQATAELTHLRTLWVTAAEYGTHVLRLLHQGLQAAPPLAAPLPKVIEMQASAVQAQLGKTEIAAAAAPLQTYSQQATGKLELLPQATTQAQQASAPFVARRMWHLLQLLNARQHLCRPLLCDDNWQDLRRLLAAQPYIAVYVTAELSAELHGHVNDALVVGRTAPMIRLLAEVAPSDRLAAAARSMCETLGTLADGSNAVSPRSLVLSQQAAAHTLAALCRALTYVDATLPATQQSQQVQQRLNEIFQACSVCAEAHADDVPLAQTLRSMLQPKALPPGCGPADSFVYATLAMHLQQRYDSCSSDEARSAAEFTWYRWAVFVCAELQPDWTCPLLRSLAAAVQQQNRGIPPVWAHWLTTQSSVGMDAAERIAYRQRRLGETCTSTQAAMLVQARDILAEMPKIAPVGVDMGAIRSLDGQWQKSLQEQAYVALRENSDADTFAALFLQLASVSADAVYVQDMFTIDSVGWHLLFLDAHKRATVQAILVDLPNPAFANFACTWAKILDRAENGNRA